MHFTNKVALALVWFASTGQAEGPARLFLAPSAAVTMVLSLLEGCHDGDRAHLILCTLDIEALKYAVRGKAPL